MVGPRGPRGHGAGARRGTSDRDRRRGRLPSACSRVHPLRRGAPWPRPPAVGRATHSRGRRSVDSRSLPAARAARGRPRAGQQRALARDPAGLSSTVWASPKGFAAYAAAQPQHDILRSPRSAGHESEPGPPLEIARTRASRCDEPPVADPQDIGRHLDRGRQLGKRLGASSYRFARRGRGRDVGEARAALLSCSSTERPATRP